MKILLTVALLVPALLAVEAASKSRYEDRFMDYGVYKIENRAVVGVLTFNKTATDSSQALPTTQEFDDANAGQRWRLDESALYTAFELRPAMDENYVLEYWNEKGFLRWLASWGLGDNKLWYLQDAGQGFTTIRNKHNKVCLQSRGINKPVGAFTCNGEHEQQWKLS